MLLKQKPLTSGYQIPFSGGSLGCLVFTRPWKSADPLSQWLLFRPSFFSMVVMETNPINIWKAIHNSFLYPRLPPPPKPVAKALVLNIRVKEGGVRTEINCGWKTKMFLNLPSLGQKWLIFLVWIFQFLSFLRSLSRLWLLPSPTPLTVNLFTRIAFNYRVIRG